MFVFCWFVFVSNTRKFIFIFKYSYFKFWKTFFFSLKGNESISFYDACFTFEGLLFSEDSVRSLPLVIGMTLGLFFYTTFFLILTDWYIFGSFASYLYNRVLSVFRIVDRVILRWRIVLLKVPGYCLRILKNGRSDSRNVVFVVFLVVQYKNLFGYHLVRVLPWDTHIQYLV